MKNVHRYLPSEISRDDAATDNVIAATMTKELDLTKRVLTMQDDPSGCHRTFDFTIDKELVDRFLLIADSKILSTIIGDDASTLIGEILDMQLPAKSEPGKTKLILALFNWAKKPETLKTITGGFAYDLITKIMQMPIPPESKHKTRIECEKRELIKNLFDWAKKPETLNTITG